ncbi:MAG: TauD/TfdA family dioxygenase [Burkholderiaceae bacterium]
MSPQTALDRALDAALSTAPSVRVEPISIHIGAEIHGVDLARGLSPAETAVVRAALLRWKVVFFRDQNLDHVSHVRLAGQFGEPTPGHVVFGGDPQHPAIYSIAKFRKANSKARQGLRIWSGWHADITAAINPPAMSILRGDVVPPYGGDTQWTNLVVACDALSPSLRAWLETLNGIHQFDPPTKGTDSSVYDEVVSKRTMITSHPLITVHPETGEKVLYISPGFLRRIEGLASNESQAILQMLWEHACLPEYTARFRWAPGSVAFWDNRSTAHLAPRDIYDADFDRQFYRVTMMGVVPTGVDGRASRAIEGSPIESLAQPA